MSPVWKEIESSTVMPRSLSAAGSTTPPSDFDTASLVSSRITTFFTPGFAASQRSIRAPSSLSEVSALRKAQGRLAAAMPGLAEVGVMIGVLPWTATGKVTSDSPLNSGPTIATTPSLPISLRVRLIASVFSPRVS